MRIKIPLDIEAGIDMQKLKGKATLLFDKGKGLTIELMDSSSRITVKAQLSSDSAITALSRVGYVECELTIPDNLERIGKKREIKTITLQRHYMSSQRSELIFDAATAGCFDDGWIIHSDGLSSRQDGTGHQIKLKRYT